ncbi:MAG TPA: MFS transporter, partial [Umezawaea sp.]|nr:MFS transporter [Umezawaea sp.]
MSGLLRKVAIDTRPLKIVAYRRLWVSTIVTAVGSQLTAVAVPKQVYDLTGSSSWVGIAAAVALVPLLVFGLYGGAVADAVDRRKLLVLTNAGIAVTSVLLWLQAAFHVESVWLIIALLGLQQVFFALNAPARSAVVARLVPGELMASAVALNSTVMT